MAETEVARLYTKREAASMLNCSEITVHRLIKSKRLGCFRVASKVLISREHLDDYLQRNERKPKAA